MEKSGRKYWHREFGEEAIEENALKNIVYFKKHELGNAKDYTMDNKIHIQQSRENQM